MPKKFNGINQKSASALARKAAAEELKLAKQQQELEDQQWRDNDKHVLRKQKRKEEKELKKQNVLEKKAQNKVLLEEETAKIKSETRGSSTPKLTRADISTNIQVRTSPKNESQTPLEENINRSINEEIDARSVTEAIAALHFQPVSSDMHPEKRMRASYKAFEKSRLEELKRENPTLRLTQLKQILHKDWEKSPENPINKLHR